MSENQSQGIQTTILEAEREVASRVWTIARTTPSDPQCVQEICDLITQKLFPLWQQYLEVRERRRMNKAQKKQKAKTVEENHELKPEDLLAQLDMEGADRNDAKRRKVAPEDDSPGVELGTVDVPPSGVAGDSHSGNIPCSEAGRTNPDTGAPGQDHAVTAKLSEGERKKARNKLRLKQRGLSKFSVLIDTAMENCAAPAASSAAAKPAAYPAHAEPSDGGGALSPADTETLSRARDFYLGKIREVLNCKDKLGRTALHLAAFAGNVSVLRELLRDLGDGETVSPVDTPAQDNMQALHFAASAGKVDAVRECLLAGARVNALSFKKKTALQLAQQRKHEDVVALLKGKGGELKGELGEMLKDEEFQQLCEQLKLGCK